MQEGFRSPQTGDVRLTGARCRDRPTARAATGGTRGPRRARPPSAWSAARRARPPPGEPSNADREHPPARGRASGRVASPWTRPTSVEVQRDLRPPRRPAPPTHGSASRGPEAGGGMMDRRCPRRREAGVPRSAARGRAVGGPTPRPPRRRARPRQGERSMAMPVMLGLSAPGPSWSPRPASS